MKELLKAFGANMLLSKLGSMGTPTMELSREGETWTMKRSNNLKSTTMTFKLGRPFDETTADGRDVSCIFTSEGNKLISIQTAKKEGQKSTKTVREFSPDECICTIEVMGADRPIVCKQVFQRL